MLMHSFYWLLTFSIETHAETCFAFKFIFQLQPNIFFRNELCKYLNFMQKVSGKQFWQGWWKSMHSFLNNNRSVKSLLAAAQSINSVITPNINSKAPQKNILTFRIERALSNPFQTIGNLKQNFDGPKSIWPLKEQPLLSLFVDRLGYNYQVWSFV